MEEKKTFVCSLKSALKLDEKKMLDVMNVISPCP